MMTPDMLQEEQRAWSLANFGPHPAHQPLLGLYEELGELDDAIRQIPATDWHPMQVGDAIGDFVIYLADYCTQHGWRLQDLWTEQTDRMYPAADLGDAVDAAVSSLLRVAHYQLKFEQGIRHTPEECKVESQRHLRNVLYQLSSIARHFGWTLMSIADTTWDGVRKRDFTKFKKNGVDA